MRVLSLVATALGLLLAAAPAGAQGLSLRFFGHGSGDIDRVKIRIDDPAVSNDSGPPVDVGATDFTIEFWMRAAAAENTATALTCGFDISWINGNILLDRDRFNQDRKFGISIGGGNVAFGVSGDGTGDHTICSTSDVLDEAWHHVAVQRRRSDGRLWLFVDGALEAEADGPDGDVSYPDDGVPGSFCGPGGTDPCDASDPFVVLGAEKHDAGLAFPSYSGWLDDLRFSDTIRYTAAFSPPAQRFTPDADTVALYGFDEGPPGPCTGTVSDTSGAAGGPSDGECRFGGAAPSGPRYSALTPFPVEVPALPPAGVWGLALLLLAAARRRTQISTLSKRSVMR